MILKLEELKEIKGGGMSLGLIASLVGLGAFLIGILDGIMRPDIGRSLGTAIRMLFSKRVCK